MNDVLKKIGEIGIIPVVVLNDAKDAAPLAKALIEGGLPCAEVTFRTAAAEESIRIMSTEYPELFLGAGTVLTIEQANRAIAAGAKFIVAPGLNPEIVQYCINRGVPVCPAPARLPMWRELFPWAWTLSSSSPQSLRAAFLSSRPWQQPMSI